MRHKALAATAAAAFGVGWVLGASGLGTASAGPAVATFPASSSVVTNSPEGSVLYVWSMQGSRVTRLDTYFRDGTTLKSEVNEPPAK